MVKLKEIPEQFKDPKFFIEREQLNDIAIREAFNQCASISELKIEIQKLNDRLSGYAPVGHSHKELHEHNSVLEVKKVEEKVINKDSLLVKVAKLILERNK